MRRLLELHHLARLLGPGGRLHCRPSDDSISGWRFPMAGYEQEYRRSLEDPEGFWGEVAQDVHWTKRWDKVLDDSNAPFYRWFRGGERNTCYDAVDVHVEEGRGEQAA